jgi:Arc/MetJ family transcription regulator
MAATLTSIRVDTHLADQARKVLGAKSRTEAVHVALREVVTLKRFKDLMSEHAGKSSFANSLGDCRRAKARLEKPRPPLSSRQVRKELGLDD